jgi:hypothetical protein
MARITRLLALLATWIPAAAFADDVSQTQQTASGAGAGGIWILANICYAGMRAQNHPSVGWRMVSFILGFPGTLITFFVVDQGSERAYGIELPKKR